jgi:Zn-dependent protease with chaperone function
VAVDLRLTARPRLSPFLLPTTTTTFFILLLVLTVGSGASGYTELFFDRLTAAGPCITAARTADPAAAVEAANRFTACVEARQRTRAGAVAGAGVAVLAVLVLVHAIVPRLEIRRFGLQAFETRRYPAVARVIEEELTRARLRRRPEFLVEPLMANPWGRAFGGFGRYRIKITTGLARARTPERLAVARAVIRHELAHVANRDLDLTGLSLASSWVFVGAVAVPVLAIGALRAPADVPGTTWRLAAVALAVLVIRAAILRSREHDADVRASVWAVDAGDSPFDPRVFPDRGGPRWQRLGGLLDTHPRSRRRAEVVDLPSKLLRTPWAEACGAGVIVGVVQSGLGTAAIEGTGNAAVGHLLLGALLGLLVASIVGTGLWRTTLRALTDGTRLPSGVATGVALGVGLIVGDLVAPQRLQARVTFAWLTAPGTTVLALVLVVALMVAWCRWTVGVAAAWLPEARHRSLRPVLRSSHVVAAAALASGLVMSSTALGVIVTRHPLAVVIGLAGTTLIPVVLLPLLLAPLYVITAGVWNTHGGAGRRLWLDHPDRVRLPRAPVSPMVVLGATIAGTSVAALAGVVFLDRVLRRLMADRARQAGDLVVADERLVQFLILGMVAVVVVVGVGAALTADRQVGGGLAPVHGVTASFLAGCAAFVAVIARPMYTVCIPPAGCDASALLRQVGTAFFVIAVSAVWTGLLTAPVVAAVGRLRRALGHRRTDRLPPPRTARPRLLRAQRVALALLVGGTIGPLLFMGMWTGTTTGIGGAPVTQAAVPADVRDAPPGPRAGSMTGRAACNSHGLGGMSPISYTENMRIDLRFAQAMRGSDDPALNTFGQALEEATRAGRTEEIETGKSAANSYCSLLYGRP